MTVQLPSPEPDPRAAFLGLPLGYGVHPPNYVDPPNLSDSSISGTYHAVTRVPSKAVDVLNRVSARIGAPELSAGGPATVIKQTYASGGAIRPIAGIVPPGITRALSVVSIQARSILQRVAGVFQSR